MKVKVISRSADHFMRETKNDVHKVFRNFDPSLHPFEAAREYTRALNAVKLEKVFAKPFLGSLDGHRDSISCIAKHPKRLSTIISGAFDGEVRIWNLPQRECLREFVAHNGIVRGIVYTPKGENFITVGDDKTIKTWKALQPQFGEDEEPFNTVLSKTMVAGISHHKKSPIFATAGEIVQLWEETRNEPLRTYQWGVDSLHDIAFNMVEPNVFGACASDRSIILYDMRDNGPLRKVIMKLRPNKISWNPMEAFTFTCANEDYNLYTFDTRNLKKPANIHMDHVGAVTFVDYAPTGREFVSGSYDKTIRIFESGHGHSREIYHTKRMQRLTCVHWTLDNKFIISGSDEMNIRIWKARAAEKLGPLRPRERTALHYAEALKEKFASHPQIKRISRHRHVPKHIYNAQKEVRTIKEKQKRKEGNRRAHSKKGEVPYVPEREKHVIKEVQ
ncbi:DDB1- and CUL4-associated factor 13 [Anthonomus grandis grandis]|uniref:DDB1- and CUL4-associated factor 13 n=1 Tax=Anthonomus grandis grandis TaxID=2921223 RepID=UPI00216570BD|nr:DDB1- and CUL4-associated factor 13 [Anthonomus grandis grandis]XP_050313204.1 DDB1- and CUL4-associated factor 13 [Anthonomus grandis grandis]